MVESDIERNETSLPFKKLEDSGTFLVLLRDAPDPTTLGDIFRLKDWSNGEASD